MAHSLPARPNLDHLREQAKTLLAKLKKGDASAAKPFIAHLPAARGKSVAAVRAAGLRLADAQSVIARQAGFASWALLACHVTELRQLEGEWHFDALQIDGGEPLPASALRQSKILIDGDRFRTESPEATYEGVLNLDVSVTPHRIDIAFVEGPEAGQTALGIYELDSDRLTLCLGLVGSTRPHGFVTAPGRGHALERLHRASSSRPVGVTGGTPPPVAPVESRTPPVDPQAFVVEMTPLLQKLQGEWVPVALVRDGTPMPTEWLPFGSRTMTGNEITIVFGGQTMQHAKVRIDTAVSPIAIDYLNLAGASRGSVNLGILEWIGDEVRFLSAAPGLPRPSGFDLAPAKGLTFSQWRRNDLGSRFPPQ